MAGRKKRFTKKLLYFTVAVFAVVSACLYYFCLITPIAYDTAKAEARTIVSEIINDALYSIFMEGVRYDELVKVEKDYDGNVVMVSALPEKANQINYLLVKRIKDGLNKNRNTVLTIPYGTFIGNIFFTGKGKDLTVNIDPIGLPKNEFVSGFVAAGINQTVHKIYIKSSVFISIILPYKTLDEIIEAEVLIAETLISGRVPEVYINSLDWGNMLDLLP